MTLLLALIAAVVSTVVWYKFAPDDIYNIKVLCYMYWGASLMWMVDAVFEYAELKSEYFTPAISDMVNDAFLGLAVIVLGLVIWAILLLVKDPKNVMGKALKG